MHVLRPFDPIVARPVPGTPVKTLVAQHFHGASNRAEPRRIVVLTREDLARRAASQRNVHDATSEGGGNAWLANRQLHFELHAARRLAEAFHYGGPAIENRDYEVEVRYPRLQVSRGQVIERKRVHFDDAVTVPKSTRGVPPDTHKTSVTRSHAFRYPDVSPHGQPRETTEQAQPPPKQSLVGKLLDLLSRLFSR